MLNDCMQHLLVSNGRYSPCGRWKGRRGGFSWPHPRCSPSFLSTTHIVSALSHQLDAGLKFFSHQSFKNTYFVRKKCIYFLKYPSSEQWTLSAFFVPFRKVLYIYGQISLSSLPHLFYKNESILYTLFCNCSFSLTVCLGKLYLSSVHEEPAFLTDV